MIGNPEGQEFDSTVWDASLCVAVIPGLWLSGYSIQGTGIIWKLIHSDAGHLNWDG